LAPRIDAPEGARRPTRWAGLPVEDRLAERRKLLLDAALELLGTVGWSGTTVRGVCQRAELNPRYFYESFDDLDALIVALYDQLIAQMGEEVLQAIDDAGDDAAAQLRAAIDRIVGFVTDDPRRARVLYVEALGNEALNKRRVETGHAIVESLDQFTAVRKGSTGKGSKGGSRSGEQIGRIAAAIVVGGTSELILSWLDGRIDVDREQLVDDATSLFLALGDAADRIASNR
jgi:AcrR family transcriptional regulator